MATVTRSLTRHWLLGTVLVLSTILGYTNIKLYGAEATPTPNVSTVPKPSLLFTPTPTATAVIVIVTRAATSPTPTTPANDANKPVAATPTAPPATGAVADAPSSALPRSPATESAGGEQGSRVTPLLSVQVDITPTLIWAGAVRQIKVAVTNHSPTALTQLDLRYAMPPGLTLMNATLDHPGATVLNSPTAQGVLLLIQWPQLAATSTAVATLLLQVDNAVPNGTFFDSQIEVTSNDGTSVGAVFTLVMPPVDLPRFRAP